MNYVNKNLLAETIITLMLMSQGVLAASAFMSGNKLLAKCESGTAVSMGACVGYIMGVSDRANGKDYVGVSYCKPAEGVEGGQAEKIVVKFLNEHPAILHMDASVLVDIAFLEAFPCE
jgi:hypothetical protein